MPAALLKKDQTTRKVAPVETSNAHDAGVFPLRSLRNVGPRFLADLELLGIRSVAELRRRDPVKLYRQLEKETGTRHDPCVLDTFMAIIHEAKTGEPMDWWKFTAARKAAFPELTQLSVRQRK